MERKTGNRRGERNALGRREWKEKEVGHWKG
jgi:hypothetical protein